MDAGRILLLSNFPHTPYYDSAIKMNHEATKITKKQEEVIKMELSKFRNSTVIAYCSASPHFFVSFVPSSLKSLCCRITGLHLFPP